MNHYKYPIWAKIYTLWMVLLAFGLLAVLDVVWIKSEHPQGYLLFVLIVILQYFYTEYRARYWPVSVVPAGMQFYARNSTIFVPWESIVSIKSFPSADYQPAQWSQAIFSSGSIISTIEGREYVIYAKIRGYTELIRKCRENT